MYTEMTYLLKELEKYPPNTVLTVGQLLEIINKSYDQSVKDEEEIEEGQKGFNWR